MRDDKMTAVSSSLPHKTQGIPLLLYHAIVHPPHAQATAARDCFPSHPHQESDHHGRKARALRLQDLPL
jgi:hypothetical protein